MGSLSSPSLRCMSCVVRGSLGGLRRRPGPAAALPCRQSMSSWQQWPVDTGRCSTCTVHYMHVTNTLACIRSQMRTCSEGRRRSLRRVAFSDLAAAAALTATSSASSAAAAACALAPPQRMTYSIGYVRSAPVVFQHGALRTGLPRKQRKRSRPHTQPWCKCGKSRAALAARTITHPWCQGRLVHWRDAARFLQGRCAESRGTDSFHARIEP